MPKAIFKGCSPSQRNYGGYTGDPSQLKVGATYTIIREEVHSFHTKVFLKEIDGSFNSVCFDEIHTKEKTFNK